MFCIYLFILLLILFFSTNKEFYNKNNNRFLKESREIFYKAVILVRASHPTNAQIDKFVQWSKSLDACYKLIILTDDKSLQILDVDIEVITANEVVSKWPAMKSQGGDCGNKEDVFYMRFYSYEHIIVWSRRAKIKFKYLWYLEQDLGYSGNINNFIKIYDKYDVDIISLPYKLNPIKWWYECFTKEYNDWREEFYDKKKRYVNQVFICRMNRKVLDILYNQFELKRHTTSEAVIPEITFIFHLSVRIISSKYIGYTCVWNGRVKPDEWEEINKSIENRNKLYHALKF